MISKKKPAFYSFIAKIPVSTCSDEIDLFQTQHTLCYEQVIDVHLSFNTCFSFDVDFYEVFPIQTLLETWYCPNASAMHIFAIKNYIHHDLKKNVEQML